MLQKIIQVGNSYAVTIPKSFTNETKWKAGQEVFVDTDIETKTLTIQPKNANTQKNSLTPEFLSWLKAFNARYKNALAELAKK